MTDDVTINVNLDRARTVQGWMEEHDLRWLAEHALTANNIVEVGSWLGRSTLALADNTIGIVFAVDTWLGSEEHQNEWYPGRNPDWCYLQFLTNTMPVADKVCPMRMRSTSAAEYFASIGYKFDFVFIDAAHDYESIKSDILAWKPLVQSGGILAGHDAGHGPIMEALDELLPKREPNAGSHWWIQL